jgi:geranylgeranyl reductase family protein
MWDVAVVGAGPAGSAAAIAARRAWPRARVALLDRAEFPRDKSCGDGVAPHVLDVLARIGVTGLLDDWPGVHRLSLGFPGGPQLSGTMRRPAYVVPRAVLDARIRDAALERGAEPVLHRVRQVEILADRVVLDGEIEARVVIGADGAHSRLRSALAPSTRAGSQAIALRAYAPVGSLPTDEQLIVFARDGGCPAYAWSFPIGDGRVNVGYGELLPPSGRTPTRALLLDRLHGLLPGLTELTGLRGHHLPLSTAGVRQPNGRILLAGDALSLVNPLTGEGIHAAVLSGALAGVAAARAARASSSRSGAGIGDGTGAGPGREYRAAMRSAYGRHTRDVGLLAGLARPRAVAAGLRGAGDRRQVFDDLVELGLADGTISPAILGAILRELRRKATLQPAPPCP